MTTQPNPMPEEIWLDEIEKMHAFQTQSDCQGCGGGNGAKYLRADLVTAKLEFIKDVEKLEQKTGLTVEDALRKLALQERDIAKLEAAEKMADALSDLLPTLKYGVEVDGIPARSCFVLTRDINEALANYQRVTEGK